MLFVSYVKFDFRRLHSSGFSCKDLSKLTKFRTEGRSSLPDASGTSGTTLAGLLAYLEAHLPEIVLLENVDDLLSPTSPNFDHLKKQLEAIGYCIDARPIIAYSYESPQRRSRAHLVCFLVPRSMTRAQVDDHVQKALDLAIRLATCKDGDKYNGPRLKSFLLKPSDQYCKDEHDRRVKFRESANVASELKDLEVWKEQNRATLERVGSSVSERVVEEGERGGQYDLLTPRQKLALGHSLHAVPDLTNVDVYQSLGRQFIGCDQDVLSTVVPGSIKWLRSLKRILLGWEGLSIQGMPPEIINFAVALGYKDSQLMDLAGNSFTGMVYAAFLIAALVWAPVEGEEADQELPDIATSVSDCLGLR